MLSLHYSALLMRTLQTRDYVYVAGVTGQERQVT
jgi:hypothetical protein